MARRKGRAAVPSRGWWSETDRPERRVAGTTFATKSVAGVHDVREIRLDAAVARPHYCRVPLHLPPSQGPVRRFSAKALLLVLPCAGCASIATTVKGSRSVVTPTGEVSSSTTRRVFSSRLQGERDSSAKVAETSEGGCWGTVKLVVNDDDSFEYLITIYNPTGQTFTGAHLIRKSPDELGAAVATLFSEVSLSDPYMQLRGTVSVNRDRKGAVLAEEIRERPGDFLVTVASRAIPAGAIVGTIE